MKNNDFNNDLFNPNLEIDKNILLNRKKTTNVNILLNRVKLENKKNKKKKLFFCITLFLIIGVSITLTLI